MDRKTFLKACGALSVAGAPIVSLFQGCATSSHTATARLDGEAAIVPLSEFSSGGAGGQADRAFILVNVAGRNRPICVYRSGPAGYTALSTTCTHLGCEVRPNAEYLACPCHGSEYSTSGEVLQGPAERPLKSYRTSVDGQQLRIYL